jgi:hypothetical protein
MKIRDWLRYDELLGGIWLCPVSECRRAKYWHVQALTYFFGRLYAKETANVYGVRTTWYRARGVVAQTEDYGWHVSACLRLPKPVINTGVVIH